MMGLVLGTDQSNAGNLSFFCTDCFRTVIAFD